MTQDDESNMSLKGKVFAITGASGIGLAAAKNISGKGATVCLADINPDNLKATEAYFTEQKRPFTITKVDVSNRAEVDTWIESIVSKYDRLDGALNAAGIIGNRHGKDAVADLDNDEWHRIIDVNLTGTMYCMRAELKRIVDGGSIVNVASIHGLKGFGHHSAYGASKWGVVGLTKAAAQENGARDIRVNAVAPGAIYTPMYQKHCETIGKSADGPFEEPSAIQRRGTADEVGNIIAFLLGPESTFVSGSVYSVDGAWN